jgi:prepilin-type N-terminal cleavage/methylation domain-containing protein
VYRTARGFTLIELMIVIAIIAVLAAILVPNMLHARAESQTASCEGTERQIATALEEYAVDTGGLYPANGVVSTALFGVNGANYLSGTPSDPVNNAHYTYTTAAPDCTAAGTKYEVIDAGGHDASVPIPTAPAGSKTIFYCSGAGLSGK